MQTDAQTNHHGVFPLAICVLPGEIVPLHIYEPQYRQLVAHRLADHMPYVMAHGTDDSYAKVGCAVHIANILKQFPDGRLNIFIRGYRRVLIGTPQDGTQQYLVAETMWLDDDPDETVSTELTHEARDVFHRVAQAKYWGPNLAVDIERDPAKLSWHVASAMSLSNAAKQELLEMTSVEDRFRTEIRWLNSLLHSGVD